MAAGRGPREGVNCRVLPRNDAFHAVHGRFTVLGPSRTWPIPARSGLPDAGVSDVADRSGVLAQGRQTLPR